MRSPPAARNRRARWPGVNDFTAVAVRLSETTTPVNPRVLRRRPLITIGEKAAIDEGSIRS